MSEAIYLLVINGKPQGPFTLEELADKKITPGSFLRKPGMDDYKEAHEFPEIRTLLGINKQYTLPQYYAGFDLRMLATAIDWLIIIGIAIIIELVLVLFTAEQKTKLLILASNLVVLPTLKFVYHVIMEAKWQATFGKKMLQIKVTDLNGQKPSFGIIFIRNLGKIISTGLLFFGYLYSFLNKKQQCLHDVIADTLVIKDRLI